MDDVVYANTDTQVVWSGGQSPIAKGEVWDANADLVKERPELFSAEPTRVRGRKPAPAKTEVSEPAEQDAKRPDSKRKA